MLAMVDCDDGGVVADDIKRGNKRRGLGRGLLGGVAMFGKKAGLPGSRRMTYTVQFKESSGLLRAVQQHQSTSPGLYSW